MGNGFFPSPVGRGWPASGVFASRRGSGEGSLGTGSTRDATPPRTTQGVQRQQSGVVEVESEDDLPLTHCIGDSVCVARSFQTRFRQTDCLVSNLPEESNCDGGHAHIGKEFHLEGPVTMTVFSLASQAA